MGRSGQSKNRGRRGSTAIALTAEMSEPNRSASSGFSASMSMYPCLAAQNVMYPMMNVDTRVPSTAYAMMVPKLRKKSLRRSVYPASKMIGGSSRKKKSSGWNDKKSSSACRRVVHSKLARRRRGAGKRRELWLGAA